MAYEKLFTPGRIGPLTMALVLAHRQNAVKPRVDYPEGHVMIG